MALLNPFVYFLRKMKEMPVFVQNRYDIATLSLEIFNTWNLSLMAHSSLTHFHKDLMTTMALRSLTTNQPQVKQ